MDTERGRGFVGVWGFLICAFIISFFISWLKVSWHITTWALLAPFTFGVLAFSFQTFIHGEPLIELYSRNHPYRKLKPYGVITAFLLFEFVLAWGLRTRQILVRGEDLFLITLIFIGAIVYYHTFVRMKISLRFLFLAIFIPMIAAGAALGLGSYFKIVKFAAPGTQIGGTIFLNTVYWILFYTFLHIVCEEPAFRGYLMQRLLAKGETPAILVSSLIFAMWRSLFVFLAGADFIWIPLLFIESLLIGIIFALLFIKGRNLLVAVLCRGIIDGLRSSLLASGVNPGIREYIELLVPQAKTELMGLWLLCLFVGLILLTIIPRKKPPY